nr:unnamed protein product [Callosobruchus chinensis]
MAVVTDHDYFLVIHSRVKSFPKQSNKKLIYDTQCNKPRACVFVNNNIKALKITDLCSRDTAVTEVHLQTDSHRPVHPEGDSADQLANYLANSDVETTETETTSTGATKSFLNPELAYKYFPKNIYKEPFEVTSVFQHSQRDYCAEIPAFPEFNIREAIKFHLFKFHKYVDGLIDLDILKLLNSHIDLGYSMLHTKNAKIPMRFQDLKKRLLFFLEIEPHTAAHVKIPVMDSSSPLCWSQAQEKREGWKPHFCKTTHTQNPQRNTTHRHQPRYSDLFKFFRGRTPGLIAWAVAMNKPEKCLKILYWNARSAVANKQSLKDFLTEENIDVALISEICFRPSEEYIFRGYRAIRNDRYDGITVTAILVKQKFQFTEVNLSDNSAESDVSSCCIKLIISTNKYINLASVYRAPHVRTNVQSWNVLFEIIGEPCIMGGDFNGHNQC